MRLRTFLFENTTLRQTVLKNTLWLGVSTAASRLIKAVLVLYVARVLGAEGYGIFSYAVGLASFFAIFSDLGVNGFLMREIAKNDKDFPSHFAASLVVKLSLIGITVLLVLGIAPFVSNIESAVPLLWLAALLIAFDSVRDFSVHVMRAEEKMQRETAVVVATNLAITIFGIVALLLRASPGALLLGYVAGSGLGAALALWGVRGYFPRFHIPRGFSRMGLEILRSAWPFGIAGMLGSIMVNTDMLMLGWFEDAAHIGLYSAALRPVQFFYFLPTLVSVSIFPALARFAREDKERFTRLFEKALTLCFAVSLPLLVGGFLLRHALLQSLFGASFLGAVPVFGIFLFTLPLNFPATFLGHAIFAHDRQKALIRSLAIGALVNAGLNALLIPWWGIAGAAVATVVAQAAAYGSMWRSLYAISPFRGTAHLLPLTLAALLMGVVVALLVVLGAPLFTVILLGAAVYALLLTLFFREPLRAIAGTL